MLSAVQCESPLGVELFKADQPIIARRNRGTFRRLGGEYGRTLTPSDLSNHTTNAIRQNTVLRCPNLILLNLKVSAKRLPSIMLFLRYAYPLPPSGIIFGSLSQLQSTFGH